MPAILRVIVSWLLFSCWWSGMPAWAWDEPSFPYQAFVLREGALVRSGPGEAHYATDELKQGQPVEVWRHDPDGWYAIRPTADSFSLIPATAVELLSADRCRVIQSGLQAWVGTRLGPVENPLWQVKLNADEELTILGEVNWPSPEGSSLTWYQIAPPAGEFRWVHVRDLQLPDPRTELPASTGEAEPTYRDTAVRPTGQFEELERPLDFGSQPSGNSKSLNAREVIIDPFGDDEELAELPGQVMNEASSGWRRARRPLRMAENVRPALTTPGPGNAGGSWDTSAGSATSGGWASLDRPAGRDLDSANSGVTPSAGGTAYVGPVYGNGGGSPIAPTPGVGNLSQELRQIDMDLSLEIVKPAGQWQFARFVQRLNDAYASAGSDAERSQAQQMLAKVDRLKGLQVTLTGRPAEEENRQVNRSTPATIGNGIAANVEYGTTYDAYGWLSECVQDSGRAPSTFVLQDDNGKIICQVTPAPGFNMHRYLRTKVGVIGQRGFNQKLNLNHVLVDRVVVLENLTSNWR